MADKILLLLTVAATCLAYSKASRQWDSSGNDYEWPLRHKIKQSDNDLDVERDDNVCQTEECQTFATSFLGSMDTTVDPCDNFYQFTCGKWSKSDHIKPDEVISSPIRSGQRLVLKRISGILAMEPEPSDILPVKQAKMWYRSCVDTESLDRRSIKPIESYVMKAGGWPIAMPVTDWGDEADWQKIDRHYASLTGHSAFYDLKAGPPNDDSKFGELLITVPELLEKRQNFMVDRSQYFKLLMSTIKLFVERSGAPVRYKSSEKQARDLINFEKKIIKLIKSTTPKNPLEAIQSNVPFHEFEQWYKSNTTKSTRIDWQAGIQNMFDPLKIKFHPSTSIYVLNIGYIRQLGTLFNETPRRTIVNYVHWSFIASLLTHTTESMRDMLFEASAMRLLAGQKKRSPRWLECTEEIKDDMKYVAAYVFSEKYFPESTRSSAREMMRNIRFGLDDNVDHSNWLDETSKSLAKEKIKAMRVFTGYPEWFNNQTAIMAYYKGLPIGSQHLENVLASMRFARKLELISYAMTDEEDDIHVSMDPITVNAEYNELSNLLNTPPAIFQPPLFTPGLPNNINYAQIGFLVGHEMGHGFDDTGIRRSQDGNETHLSTTILKSYYQRARCFVDQFDKYFGVTAEPPPEDNSVTAEFDDLGNSRGSITKGENIADTTGLGSVFRAYDNLNMNQVWNEPKLPGLEKYSDNQLFFIAFGAFWCGQETPEFENLTKDDPHSPNNLRVNGAVSNVNGFAKVFNCPAGSPMNPSDKCDIWQKPGAAVAAKTTSRGMHPRWSQGTHRRWIKQWKN